MKVSITGKSENQLLKRTELTFKVEDVRIPPSRKELRAKIAALQNVKEEQVIVAKISHGFGSKGAEGTARVYASVEELEKTELRHIIGRNRGEKKKKKAEEKKPPEKGGEEKQGEAEKPQETGKGEEKKEEKPAEEKKEKSGGEDKTEEKTEEKPAKEKKEEEKKGAEEKKEGE